ncbi:MAG: winged helix-turn-helix transcriptional regulator [archaeon]|nr:winged helix-turn-helix transcriptional regulator [archaeon]
MREIFPTVPVKVEYTLTELGQTLRPIIEPLKEWGLAYQSLNSGQ